MRVDWTCSALFKSAMKKGFINGFILYRELTFYWKVSFDFIQYIYISFRVKNSRSLHKTFNVDPLYLQHENSGLAIDYMVLFSIKISNMLGTYLNKGNTRIVSIGNHTISYIFLISDMAQNIFSVPMAMSIGSLTWPTPANMQIQINLKMVSFR